MALQFVVLATAWNILGGYVGYVNFGSAAFFAVGAYTAVAFGKGLDAPLPLQILAGAMAAGVLGLVVGLMTMRLRGIYFSIATIAMSIVIETAVINWSYVGGARGLALERPPSALLFDSYLKWLFFVMALLAVVAVACARYVQGSWIGRGLRAIRDSEEAAECSGVPSMKLKLLASAMSGALMGAAGAPFSMYLSFIEPNVAFSLNIAIYAMAMPIVGGMAHWSGPVIGAVLLGILLQLVTVTLSAEAAVLSIGVLLLVVVVAAPDGLLGLWRKTRARLAPEVS
ncbi:branched-chain amino acid ABC transporter permease [Variovorax sp. WS11]|nr:branched-chain amino acid ABC transporter permease [Variovorax sp. WS11]